MMGVTKVKGQVALVLAGLLGQFFFVLPAVFYHVEY